MGETKLALQVKVEWLESKLAQAEARVLELGAEAAALREALERMLIGAKHMSCAYKPDDPDPTWHCCDWSEVVEEIEQALSTTAGRDLLERMEKLEQVAEAAREFTRGVRSALAAMDGDQNG